MTTLQLPAAVTAGLDRSPVPAYVVGTPRLLSATPPAVPERSLRWLTDATRDVALLGRGGAAFPVAAKLAAAGRRAEVLVNGCEGEPASWKDRVLMRRSPGLVVDGALLLGRALQSREITIAVGDPASAAALRSAAAEREGGRRVHIVPASSAFVGGEVQALVNGINGRAAVPNGRRVLPSERGLGGRPTFASNVETFAQLALLAALGPDGYAEVGTAAEPGTALATVHQTGRPLAVVEVPHGTPLTALVGSSGPVLLGGYHGTWSPTPTLIVERHALRAAGLTWGAGVVAVLPAETCAIGELARVAAWLAAESAGQCGPCVFGLRSIAADLAGLARGETVDVAALRRRLGLVDGRGACAHPSGAVRFVATGLAAYAEELRAHEDGRGCGRRTVGALPLGTLTAGAGR